MFKTSVKFFITILITILLINSNSIAFHKENSLTALVKTEWDGSKETKKDFENQAKQEFCALNAKGVSVVKKGGGDPIIDQNTGKQTINEETGKPVFEDKKVFRIELKGYHSTESKKVENNT